MSERYDPQKHLSELEMAKRMVRIPCPREMRDLLFLSDEQFRTLLEVDRVIYSDLMSGSKQFTTNQKLFLHEVLRIMKEKGLLNQGPDY